MPSNRVPSSSRVLNNRSSVSSNRSVLSKQPSQQRAQQAQQPPQRRVQQQPERTSEVAQAWQQQRGWVSAGGWQGHATWQQERKNRSQNWVSDHRSWAQRGGYGDYYIPQNSFDLYFGSQHFFRLRTGPGYVHGISAFRLRRVFVPAGRSIPGRGDWSANWYSTDDYYIDYEDGYYLHNRRYPGISLAITIAL